LVFHTPVALNKLSRLFLSTFCHGIAVAVLPIIPNFAEVYCDSLQGPVVADARLALVMGDPAPALKSLKKENEGENASRPMLMTSTSWKAFSKSQPMALRIGNNNPKHMRGRLKNEMTQCYRDIRPFHGLIERQLIKSLSRCVRAGFSVNSAKYFCNRPFKEPIYARHSPAFHDFSEFCLCVY
jgi:hypothetical protein